LNLCLFALIVFGISDFFSSRVKTYLDVGANIGLYCLRAAHVNQNLNILAFEPAQEHYNFLQLSNKLNKWENRFKTFNYALGSAPGNGNIFLSGTGSSLTGNFLSSNQNENDAELAKIITLDSAMEGSAKSTYFMKINVGGYELFVLEGAKEFLFNHKPVMFIEIVAKYDDKSYANLNFHKTIDLISQFGYKIYVSDKKRRIKRFNKSRKVPNGVFMYLCLPKETHSKEYVNLKIYLLQQKLKNFSKIIRGYLARVRPLYRRLGFTKATKLIFLKAYSGLMK
jgi:FkbM family methyltransferase